MFGVSPAFTISLYGTGFTASQMADGLALLPSLGFDAYQPEVYRPDEVDRWLADGAATVAAAARDASLTATQFVAHFLIESFSDEDSLASPFGIEEFGAVCEICRAFPTIGAVTVPIGPFVPGRTGYEAAHRRLVEKLGRMGAVAERSGVRIALEVLPGSIIGGPAGIRPLIDELGGGPFGYNVDTGHAWACRDNPAWAIERLADLVLGTHLCDNDGNTNASLAPGSGTIDWPPVLRALRAAGYEGSFDIEIHTAADQVSREYRAAREFIARLRAQHRVGSDSDISRE